MSNLVRDMQTAPTEREAHHAASLLEWEFFPNGALQSGCDLLTRDVFAGLDGASPAGITRSWALLSDVAAAAAHDDAGQPELVAATREVFMVNAGRAVERLTSASPEPYDLLVLDVVDCLIDFAPVELTEVLRDAVRVFGRRGRRESEAADVVLSPRDPDVGSM